MKQNTYTVNLLSVVFSLICTTQMALAAALDAEPMPSPTPQANDDIRPIRGAVQIPEPEESNLLAETWPIAVSLLVVLVLIATVIWLKRRSEARRIPNLQQKATKALELSKKLISEKHSRDYSISVSGIVREFIESRFHLPATQRTTEEFISTLAKDKNLDLGPYWESLNHFLQQSDFGKFSGDALNIKVMENLYQAALEVVQSESKSNHHSQGS